METQVRIKKKKKKDFYKVNSGPSLVAECAQSRLCNERHGQIIQVAATPLQRGDEEDEQCVRFRGRGLEEEDLEIRMTMRVGLGCWILSGALLQEAVCRWEQVRVVASAMPVLCFVPVVRVIAFARLPLPLPLPLPSAVLILLIFAVAIPSFPPLVLLAPWELKEIRR